MAAKYINSGMDDGCQIHVARVQIASGTDADAKTDVILGPSGNSLYTSDNNSTGAFPVFYVQAGITVVDLLVDKVVAFNSTGAMTMNIGDTDIDGFWPNTDLVATDAGVKSLKTAVAGSTGVAATFPAYMRHRPYSATPISNVSTGDTFDSDGWCPIKVTIGTAKLSAGKADLYLYYYDRNSTK